MAASVAMDGGTPPADSWITVYCNDPNVDGGFSQCEDDNITYDLLAFDVGGNLWVTGSVSLLSGRLLEYSAAQLDNLARDHEPRPAFYTYGSPNGGFSAQTVAFDRDGEIWIGGGAVAPDGGPNLLRFNPGTLLDGGTPDVSLSVPGDTSVSLAFSPIPSGLPIQP